MKYLDFALWCFQLLALQCLPIAPDLAVQYNSAINIRTRDTKNFNRRTLSSQVEASMNLLNIFRKNKYYEQLLFKALIQITCYRANVGEKRTEAELGLASLYSRLLGWKGDLRLHLVWRWWEHNLLSFKAQIICRGRGRKSRCFWSSPQSRAEKATLLVRWKVIMLTMLTLRRK